MDEHAVKVATDALREYAKFLRKCSDRVEGFRGTVDAGKLPIDAWGVFITGVMAPRPTPQGETSDAFPVIEDAPPALRLYKQAYYAAHNATTQRLLDLQRVYWETANALRIVADRYDAADMRRRGYRIERPRPESRHE